MPEIDPLAGISVPRVDQQVLGSIPVGEASYGNIDKTVRGLTSVPGLTETILPAIKNLLMPGEDNPYAKMIDRSTGAKVAGSQTRMQQRGMTGSDIEESAAVGLEGEGEMAKSAFFAENAKVMAGFIKELATGDISMQRENLTMFAQLMGQKITSDNDLMMFREQLAANIDQAGKNRKSALWGSLIGSGGQMASAALMGSTGGAAAPVVGMTQGAK